MKSHLRLLLSSFVAAALLFPTRSPIHAADRIWINPDGGIFSTATNWTGGVPIAGDSANFNLADSGYTVSFTSGPVNTLLRLQNDTVTFDLNGFGYTITGGSIIGQQNGDISRLTLLDGVFSNGNDVSIASASASEAFLTVSSGSTLSVGNVLRVGTSATGTLIIANGGRATSPQGIIGQGAAADGSVNINGVESSWTTTGQLLVADQGTGSLVVSAAGLVTNQSAIVGNGPGAIGTATISGFSSDWRVNNQLTVGEGGNASVRVQSGASLSSVDARIGRGASASGAVTITGLNSTWTNSNVLVVGDLGTGSLAIADGATVNTQNLAISTGPTASGSLGVTGHGTRMNATGSMSIGQFGFGELAVTGGGEVRGAATELGTGPGAAGTLLVSDPGSRFALSASFTVGDLGRGTVSVSNGGALSTGTSVFAVQPVSFASGVISGAGSSWQIGTNLTLGVQGHGSLTISDGAAASANGDLSIATMAGSNGSLTITGPGSRFDADRFFVGGTSTTTTGGTGLLAIGSGASASATTSARVIFGSRLTIDQGTFSTGLIDNRGLIVNTDGLILANSLSNFGTLRLAGSAARVAASFGNSGLVTGTGEIAGSLFNSAGGEIRVSAGEHLLFSASGNASQGRINLLGGTLEFANSLTNADIGTITGHGTLIFANSFSNGGKMQFSGGPTDIFGNVTFTGGTGGGEMINSGGANVVTFYDDVAHNGDEIRTSPTNTTVFFGNVTGAGPFTGTGAVRFEGTFSPGNSPGQVAMDGDVELSAGSQLLMELSGVRDNQHDQLQVGGELLLGGSLEVSLLDGFAPRYGDAFDLFDYSALAGRFDTLNLPVLGAGLVWDTSALYSSGAITAVPEPAGWLLAATAGVILMQARRRRAQCSC